MPSKLTRTASWYSWRGQGPTRKQKKTQHTLVESGDPYQSEREDTRTKIYAFTEAPSDILPLSNGKAWDFHVSMEINSWMRVGICVRHGRENKPPREAATDRQTDLFVLNKILNDEFVMLTEGAVVRLNVELL